MPDLLQVPVDYAYLKVLIADASCRALLAMASWLRPAFTPLDEFFDYCVTRGKTFCVSGLTLERSNA